MKNVSMRKVLALLLAVAMTFTLCSCNYDSLVNTDTEEFYLAKNDVMPEQAKAETDKISEAFLSFINTADPSKIEAFLPQDFSITTDQLKTVAQQYIDRGFSAFKPYDTYYINNIKPDEITRKFKKSADAEVGIEITPAQSELFMALFLSENEQISHTLSMLCAKYGNDWKIVWMDGTDFAYNGLDANALYKLGVEKYQQGDFFSAVFYAMMTSLTMRPGNAMYYKDTDLMQDFYYQTVSEFQQKYPSPYAFEGLSSKVTLNTVNLATQEGNLLPLIVFDTPLDLAKESEIKAQARKVWNEIEKLSPGFMKTFPEVVFTAVSSDPNTNSLSEVQITFSLTVK